MCIRLLCCLFINIYKHLLIESLSERAEIRKSLVNDDVWANEFLPAAMECLSVQENCTMLETSWSKDLACTDLKGKI